MKVKGRFLGQAIQTKKGGYMRRFLIGDDLHMVYSKTPAPLQAEGEAVIDVRFAEMAFLSDAA